MHNKGGSPVAFVEYQDLRSASEAMNRLHGFVLLSSERGGIRIEYAKNKMGEVGTPQMGQPLPPQVPCGALILPSLPLSSQSPTIITGSRPCLTP